MNENIIRYIKIEVLTPVHIGAGTDKKWIRDIDFFYDNGNVKVFDLAEILKNKNEDFISKVANAVLERKLFDNKNNLIQKNQIAPIIEYKHNRNPDEIFTHIRSGMGKAFIPGSSLKGAITSALLGYLYENDNEIRQIGRVEKIDEEVFGGVENSVMRLIQIADAGFQNKDLELFSTKIYSLNFNMNGQWKHQRKGSKPEFDTQGFVSTYECLKYGSRSFTRIVVVKNIIDKIEDKKKPKNINKILKVENTDAVVELFKMINQQTKNYLDKEIKFFEEHGGDRSESIIETLESLREKADECQPHECILHLGSGSGFHGITGDWQFDSHTVDAVSPLRYGQKFDKKNIINLKNKLKEFYQQEKLNMNDSHFMIKFNDIIKCLENYNHNSNYFDIGLINDFYKYCSEELKKKKNNKEETIDSSFKSYIKIISIIKRFYENQFIAKTRRLIFKENNGDYVFYPMGFVKLSITDENEYNTFFNALKKDVKSKDIEESKRDTSTGSSILAENEKEKQIVPFDGKIKQGATGIPAEVVESGKPNKVRIFIKDYTKNDVFVLGGYNNPLEKGKKIYVRLGTINGKGEIIQVSFDKFMT